MISISVPVMLAFVFNSTWRFLAYRQHSPYNASNVRGIHSARMASVVITLVDAVLLVSGQVGDGG